ncbi:putative undecaprenyl diphosphate synthase-domain-containing protein [Blastocladiella britannica]|nr:putative undecaprenyl diphosphate synthase-domain-containing protein [Blastocladiella britannica]
MATTNWLSSLAQSWCIRALSHGPVPAHVAFIMDGNRRFAKRRARDSKYGHLLGWTALQSSLEWCLDLGVRVVTVYAFSIENFKRDPEEVKYLFDMMIDKLQLLSTESELVERHRIRIRICGQVSLLPLPVQQAAYDAERRTARHSGAILNICIPYTSRNEMAHAVSRVRSARETCSIAPTPPRSPFERAPTPSSSALATDPPSVERDSPDGSREDLSDLSPAELDAMTRQVEAKLYTAGCPPVDILLRTSGECRLSDFLLWQVCRSTTLQFVAPSWPEFSFWTFLPCLLDFQLARLGRSAQPPAFTFPTQLTWDPSRYPSALTASTLLLPAHEKTEVIGGEEAAYGSPPLEPTHFAAAQ